MCACAIFADFLQAKKSKRVPVCVRVSLYMSLLWSCVYI